jgi:hypothetical protein
MRPALLVVVALTVSCGGNGVRQSVLPAGPTSPPAPQGTWTLSGTTSETAPTGSTRIPGATITILDGLNAGRSATTDANGAFQLASLHAGSFTIRTRAADYVESSQPLTLGSDQSVAIELDPVFQILTSTKNEALGGGVACPGYWDVPSGASPCSAEYVVNVHHDGSLTAALTWAGSNDVMLVLDLFRSVGGRPSGNAVSLDRQGANLAAHTQYIVHVSKFGAGGASPPAGSTPFSLTLTHPN